MKTYGPITKRVSRYSPNGTLSFLDTARTKKLVHIQQLGSAATECVHDTIGRLSHPSFLSLLCCYHYEGSAFLVWEPVELSLAQVMGSKYAIREAELVSIVWPVSFDFPLLALRYSISASSSPPFRSSREFDTYGTPTEPLPPSRTSQSFSLILGA
jgi:hypothetical protein